MSTVVTAGIPRKDGCPVLTRLKAFIVDQGVLATLEHAFRDKLGKVADLSPLFPESSASASETAGQNRIKLRIKEFLGSSVQPSSNPLWEVDGAVIDAGRGKIQATLDADLVQLSGMYELSWAVVNEDDAPVLVDRGLLSIERSLWTADPQRAMRDVGPPTLQEIRQRMFDSSAADNTLLAEIEFGDEQILLAMAEPIRAWNEEPPPIGRFTTRDFPFRGAWVTGIMAQLHLTAGNHYRRNRLAHSAGGTSIDDKNKEREYMAEGQRLWTDYILWLRRMKAQINARSFVGSLASAYSALRDW